MKFQLADIWDKSRMHPHLYKPLDDDELDKIKPGDYVKVIFEADGTRPETLWVRVTQKHRQNIKGLLANQPNHAGFGDAGDLIVFETRNVLALAGG